MDADCCDHLDGHEDKNFEIKRCMCLYSRWRDGDRPEVAHAKEDEFTWRSCIALIFDKACFTGAQLLSAKRPHPHLRKRQRSQANSRSSISHACGGLAHISICFPAHRFSSEHQHHKLLTITSGVWYDTWQYPTSYKYTTYPAIYTWFHTYSTTIPRQHGQTAGY